MVAAVAILIHGCATTPPDSARPSTIVEELDRLAAATLDERRTPGLTLVVLRGDDTVFARGYGLAEVGREEAIAATTVFQLGSISKQFLAALVVKLAEEGRLALDDAVSAHLPEFDLLPASLRVRHLLSHTSGIRELFTQPAYGEGIEDLSRGPEELVAIARRSPVDFSPGARWSYSNTNYTILALLVERLTGMPYETALAEHLFGPLGLTSMRQCTPLPLGPGEARGHVLRDGALVPAAPENMHWCRGDGGICGNAVDLARWTRLFATGRVVSPQSYALMTAPTRLTDGREVDYGFALSLVAPDGQRKVAHGGAMLGFTGTTAYYPDSALTVVVLTNRGNVRTESIERRIARRLLGLFEPTLDEHSLSPAMRRRLVGTFDIGVFDVAIVDRAGQIWLEMPRPGPTIALRYLGDGEFVGAADPDAYRLTFGGEGQAQELRLFMAAMHWYGIRRPDR